MKKKSAKLTALFLSAIMILGSAAGCSPGKSSESGDTSGEGGGKVEIKMMNYIISEASQKNFEAMIAQYNQENPNVNVKLEMMPFANYTDKITTSVNSGMIPDTAIVKYSWYELLKEHMMPIDDYFSKWQYKDDIEENLVDLYRAVPGDDKLYFMPYNTQASYFYYRKDLFEEAGITKTPDTWDEWLEDAKKLTIDKDGDGVTDQYGVSLRSNANGHETWYCYAMADMENPGFYDKDGNISMTQPEQIEGSQFYLDIFRKYKLSPPTTASDGTNENIAYLTSGKAAMMIQHIQQSEAIKEALGDKVGAFPIPKGKNGKRFVCAGENAFTIFKESEHPEETFKLISWLVEPDQHRKVAESGDSMVFMKSLEKEIADKNEFQAISLEASKDIVWAPLSPYMAEYATKDWPAIISKALLDDSVTAESVMADSQKKLYPDSVK